MKINAKLAETFKDKALGLIDIHNSPPMLFKTRWGIHTFFLSYPIDVLVLDNYGVVQKIKNSLPPNCFFFYSPVYNLVLEMKSGFISKNKIRVGAKIDLN